MGRDPPVDLDSSVVRGLAVDRGPSKDPGSTYESEVGIPLSQNPLIPDHKETPEYRWTRDPHVYLGLQIFPGLTGDPGLQVVLVSVGGSWSTGGFWTTSGPRTHCWTLDYKWTPGLKSTTDTVGPWTTCALLIHGWTPDHKYPLTTSRHRTTR